jgi:hypothetical protein
MEEQTADGGTKKETSSGSFLPTVIEDPTSELQKESPI